VNEGDSSLKTDIQSKIKQYTNTKYDDINTEDFINLATILDPRFKKSLIIVLKKTKLITGKIIAEGKIVASRMEESLAPGEIMLTEATQVETVQIPVNKKRKLSEILGQSKASVSATRAQSVKQCIQDELTQYLLLSCLEIKSNALEWWKIHQTHFQYC